MQQNKNLTIITQNIDGLHQDAGNKNVIELHGSIKRNYCEQCGTFFDLDYIINSPKIPTCNKCGSIIKPDVVLYEEPLNNESINDALKAISSAELIIIGGTSLNVYPAAGLIQYKNNYCKVAIINFESTPKDYLADFVIHDDIGKILDYISK